VTAGGAGLIAVGAFVDAPRTTPGLPQPGIAGNWWVLAGITFVILGLLVLLLTGGHMCWSYWRSRPRRHPTRRERRERKQAERETQSTSQASRDEDERRRAEPGCETASGQGHALWCHGRLEYPRRRRLDE